MENKFEHIDDLIAKLLTKEATESEKQLVEQWIHLSVENKTYFNDMKFVFEASLETDKQQLVNVDKAWNNLQQRLVETKNKKAIVKSIFSTQYFRIAAAIALLVSTGVFFYYQTKQSSLELVETKLSASNVGLLKDTLPDGSSVALNKNSIITYSNNFGKKNREIKLVGEAFFNVKHIQETPFIININNVFIKDIGTSFNVKALPGATVVEVYVEEGEVAFYSESNPGLLLVKGEHATYNTLNKQFTKTTQFDKNELFYETNSLKFENTSFKDVVETLNKAYHTNIVLSNPKLNNCKLTATFTENTIDPILDIISETFGLTITKTAQTILLEGEGCEN